MQTIEQKEDIQPIPDRVLSWLTIPGFIDLYREKCAHTTTLKAAYELAEQDYQTAYKKRRYKEYQIFLGVKWKYTNKILRKNKTK